MCHCISSKHKFYSINVYRTKVIGCYTTQESNGGHTVKYKDPSIDVELLPSSTDDADNCLEALVALGWYKYDDPTAADVQHNNESNIVPTTSNASAVSSGIAVGISGDDQINDKLCEIRNGNIGNSVNSKIDDSNTGDNANSSNQNLTVNNNHDNNENSSNVNTLSNSNSSSNVGSQQVTAGSDQIPSSNSKDYNWTIGCVHMLNNHALTETGIRVRLRGSADGRMTGPMNGTGETFLAWGIEYKVCNIFVWLKFGRL